MRYKNKADVISIGLSVVCIVHCLLLPLLLTSLPLLGIELLENKALEIFIIVLSAAIGGYAIRKGYIQFHGKWHVLGLFILGLSLMIAGNLVPFKIEAVFKLIGALFIVLSHLQNWRLASSCKIPKNNSGIAFAE